MRYETDPDHTFVLFEVTHFATSTVRARFDTVAGHVDFDEEQGSGHAEITIDTNSVSSGITKFDEHLRSPDFLDVANYPQAEFKSDDFTFEEGKLVRVAGELTLLGETKPVVLTGQRFNGYDSPILETYVYGGDFETTIKRSEWGLDWGLQMGVPDEVRLLIQIEAGKK
jgi:polyisoprenoid-binding protein YceI